RQLYQSYGFSGPERPLDVHPGFAGGLDGAFAKALKTIVLKYAGWDTLYRFTAMLLTRHGEKWIFQNGLRDGAQIVEANIPTSAKVAQVVPQNGRPIFGYDTALFSATSADFAGADTVRPAWLRTATIAKLSDADVAGALQDYARIEDPTINNFNTI